MHELLGSFVDIALNVKQKGGIRSENRQSSDFYPGYPLLVVVVVVVGLVVAVIGLVVVVVVVVVGLVAVVVAADLVVADLVADLVADRLISQTLRLIHHYI